jgi:hypothetical protein
MLNILLLMILNKFLIINLVLYIINNFKSFKIEIKLEDLCIMINLYIPSIKVKKEGLILLKKISPIYTLVTTILTPINNSICIKMTL